MVMTVEDYENPNSEAHKSYRFSLIGQLMETGESKGSSGKLVDDMIALELDQIKNGMPSEEAADINNYNNTFTMDELDAMMPELGTKEFFTALGFDGTMLFQVYDAKALKVTASSYRCK